MNKTLDKVAVGATATVARINGEGPVKRRIMDMGLTKGVEVTVLATEDLNDWSPAALVPMALDALDGTWKPAESLADPNYVYPSTMFFRWCITVECAEEE